MRNFVFSLYICAQKERNQMTAHRQYCVNVYVMVTPRFLYILLHSVVKTDVCRDLLFLRSLEFSCFKRDFRSVILFGLSFIYYGLWEVYPHHENIPI